MLSGMQIHPHSIQSHRNPAASRLFLSSTLWMRHKQILCFYEIYILFPITYLSIFDHVHKIFNQFKTTNIFVQYLFFLLLNDSHRNDARELSGIVCVHKKLRHLFTLWHECDAQFDCIYYKFLEQIDKTDYCMNAAAAAAAAVVIATDAAHMKQSLSFAAKCKHCNYLCLHSRCIMCVSVLILRSCQIVDHQFHDSSVYINFRDSFSFQWCYTRKNKYLNLL